MSINLGLRHDRLLREQAAQMFERGFGYGLTARKLGVSAATVREWQKMYHVIGRDGLLTMGVKRTKYDYETKVAAAKAVVDGGMSKPEAMVHFGIASATPLKQWCRLYPFGLPLGLGLSACAPPSRYSLHHFFNDVALAIPKRTIASGLLIPPSTTALAAATLVS